jgi:hypothetical protein
MKAIAKQDKQYLWYNYTNFITGNKYDVKERPDEFVIDITDEKGELITYCGNKDYLEELFEFVEE